MVDAFPAIGDIAASSPAQSAGATQRNFFVSLESLRGIAALVVAIHHISWVNFTTDIGAFKNGYLMVDFFFVLSGFVIAHSQHNQLTNVRSAARFMWLRFGRLYPLHLLMLFVFLGIELLRYVAQSYSAAFDLRGGAFSINTGAAFVSHLALMQAFGINPEGTFNLPSWSIGDEFYVYLLFSFLALTFKSNAARGWVALALGTAALALLLAIFDFHDINIFNSWSFLRCMWGFLLGVFGFEIGYLMMIRADAKALRAERWDLVQGAVLLLAVVFASTNGFGYPIATFAFPLVALVIVVAAALAQGSRITNSLSMPALKWLGEVSYSIYMVHYAVNWAVKALLMFLLHAQAVSINRSVVVTPPSPFIGNAAAIVYLAIVLVLSHATYRYVEAPCRQRSRQLAERWFAKRAVGAVVVGSLPEVPI